MSDIKVKKQTMKDEGLYSYRKWRKFLTSQNIYTMQYHFNSLQVFSNGIAFGVLYLTMFMQSSYLISAVGAFYTGAMLLNNFSERHFRARAINKVYLVMQAE